MPQATMLSWNLGALTPARINGAGMAYIHLIADVMSRANAVLVGFCGILAQLANPIGQALVTELNNRTAPNTWNHLASPPLGAGRNEQYLCVWNLRQLSAYPGAGNNYWMWDYPNPNAPGTNYGFPNSYAITPDLPPFTLFFQLAGSTKRMPIVMFHAPDWVGAPPHAAIAQACANINQIGTFDLGQGSLIMGSFNVPVNDDVTVPLSNGAVALGALAGAAGKYHQVLNNQRSALWNTPEAEIGYETAVAQTSDNFFLRRDSANNGITAAAGGVMDLLTLSLETMDAQFNDVPAPLRPSLALVEATVLGNFQDVPTAPDGSYLKFDDAFATYREWVSNHLPIGITLNY